LRLARAPLRIAFYVPPPFRSWSCRLHIEVLIAPRAVDSNRAA
jgi:hypothetical protein